VITKTLQKINKIKGYWTCSSCGRLTRRHNRHPENKIILLIVKWMVFKEFILHLNFDFDPNSLDVREKKLNS